MGLCGTSALHSMTHHGSVLTEVSTLYCKTMKTKHKSTAKTMCHSGHKQHVYHIILVLCWQATCVNDLTNNSASQSACLRQRFARPATPETWSSSWLSLATAAEKPIPTCSGYLSQRRDAVLPSTDEERLERPQIGHRVNTEYPVSTEPTLQDNRSNSQTWLVTWYVVWGMMYFRMCS